MPVQDRLTPRTRRLVSLLALLVGVLAAVQLVRGVVALAGPGPEVTFVAESTVDRVEGTVPAADAGQYLSGEQRSALDEQRRTDVRETAAAGTVLVLAGAVLALSRRRAGASG
ncbi:hypothetical protein [Blastococcus sp. SYSU D01042]